MGLLSLVGMVGASASVASSGFLAYTNISNKARRRREEEGESAKFELRRTKAEDKATASVLANIQERDEVRKIEGSMGREEDMEILASKWVAFLNNFVILQHIQGEQQLALDTYSEFKHVIPVPVIDIYRGRHRPRIQKNELDNIRRKLRKSGSFKVGQFWSYIPTIEQNNIEYIRRMEEDINQKYRFKQVWKSSVDMPWKKQDFGDPLGVYDKLKKKHIAFTRQEFIEVLDICKCYADKTSGMRDFYSLGDKDRLERMHLLLGECGGSRSPFFRPLIYHLNWAVYHNEDLKGKFFGTPEHGLNFSTESLTYFISATDSMDSDGNCSMKKWAKNYKRRSFFHDKWAGLDPSFDNLALAQKFVVDRKKDDPKVCCLEYQNIKPLEVKINGKVYDAPLDRAVIPLPCREAEEMKIDVKYRPFRMMADRPFDKFYNCEYGSEERCASIKETEVQRGEWTEQNEKIKKKTKPVVRKPKPVPCKVGEKSGKKISVGGKSIDTCDSADSKVTLKDNLIEISREEFNGIKNDADRRRSSSKYYKVNRDPSVCLGRSLDTFSYEAHSDQKYQELNLTEGTSCIEYTNVDWDKRSENVTKCAECGNDDSCKCQLQLKNGTGVFNFKPDEVRVTKKQYDRNKEFPLHEQENLSKQHVSKDEYDRLPFYEKGMVTWEYYYLEDGEAEISRQEYDSGYAKIRKGEYDALPDSERERRSDGYYMILEGKKRLEGQKFYRTKTIRNPITKEEYDSYSGSASYKRVPTYYKSNKDIFSIAWKPIHFPYKNI